MIGVKGVGGTYSLYKPETPTALDPFYFGEDDGMVVRVRWTPGSPTPPAVLYFVSDEELITAVGFAEAGKEIPECTSQGSCGGCFSLYEDISGKERRVAVANWGEQPKGGYHFALWLNGKRFDPQIYNEGEVHPLPDGEGRKRGFLVRLLQRLVARLTRR